MTEEIKLSPEERAQVFADDLRAELKSRGHKVETEEITITNYRGYREDNIHTLITGVPEIVDGVRFGLTLKRVNPEYSRHSKDELTLTLGYHYGKRQAYREPKAGYNIRVTADRIIALVERDHANKRSHRASARQNKESQASFNEFAETIEPGCTQEEYWWGDSLNAEVDAHMGVEFKRDRHEVGQVEVSFTTDPNEARAVLEFLKRRRKEQAA